MRTRYTIINALANVGGQILSMLLNFISRMVFIRYLSSAYLGVNGLFTDVLGILNLAELGIGTAMIFSMYEPAARDDEHKLAQLMNLYKYLYRIVAAFVFAAGLLLMPFLPFFIKDSGGIENIRLIYMLYVLNSACSYLLSYKNSIYLAYQKAYIRTLYVQAFDCIRILIQIAILILTRNFILYLVAQFVIQFIPNIIIAYKVNKEFPYLKDCKELPDKEERNGIMKNVGAMTLHKLATIIVRNTDSLIMSSFIGLVTVGMYSNYRLVLNNLNNLIGKLTKAFSGSIGNLAALENPEKLYKIYRELDLGFFVLGGYISGGLMMLFNPFIAIFFGEQYCFPMVTVTIIVVEFYITQMRQNNLLFREAMGLFWYDRYKAIIESIVNLVVSLILVQKYGVAGVIGGTIISSLTTCAWMEPYVLMKYGIRDEWQTKLKVYFADYLKRTCVMAVLAVISYFWVRRFPVNNIAEFVLDGLLYTAVFAITIFGIYHKTEEYRSLKNRVMGIVLKVKGKKGNA